MADSDIEVIDLDKLIKKNIKFIESVARKYADDNNFEDLVQEGIIGLILAAEKFDPSYNVTFLTYGGYWINKRIFSYIKEDGKYALADFDKGAVDKNVTGTMWSAAESSATQMSKQDAILEVSKLKERAIKELQSKNATTRDIDIIMSRYLSPDPETLQTLGSRYNLSRERVRQIELEWTNYLKRKLSL